MTCATLLFLDIETTGFDSPHITELSLCSVNRQQFLMVKPGELPRVTNRLTLTLSCMHPNRMIVPAASEITHNK